MIEIGTLVRLESRAVALPTDVVKREIIECDEDRPIGLVTSTYGSKIIVKWIKGNPCLGYYIGSTDRVSDWQLEIIA